MLWNTDKFFCLHFEKSRDIIDTHHFLFSTLLGFLVFANPVSVAVGYLLIRNSVIEVTSFFSHLGFWVPPFLNELFLIFSTFMLISSLIHQLFKIILIYVLGTKLNTFVQDI